MKFPVKITDIYKIKDRIVLALVFLVMKKGKIVKINMLIYY